MPYFISFKLVQIFLYGNNPIFILLSLTYYLRFNLRHISYISHQSLELLSYYDSTWGIYQEILWWMISVISPFSGQLISFILLSFNFRSFFLNLFMLHILLSLTILRFNLFIIISCKNFSNISSRHILVSFFKNNMD